MESSAKSQIDVEIGLPSPPAQPPSTVVSQAASESGDADQERLQVPDIIRPDWRKEGMPDTAFNCKYPPEPWGEEAAPNARVWKIYRDQQDASHKGMLHGWNKTLDVLLIFAGLFSAVLTAFLIESYKVLQPDYTQYVATFLYAAAAAHNRTGGVFPTLDTLVAPEHFIQVSTGHRWTNGLWFTGLIISLTVALLCILIKQWLDAYDSHVSVPAPSPLHWARRHALYYRGLRKWGVPGLISFLPLLLHLSLFLFFVGLILFLRPLDDAISYWLLALISCIAVFYMLSLVLPIWRVECPSYTPLLAQMSLAVSGAVSRVISGLLYVLEWLRMKTIRSRRKVLKTLSSLARRMVDWLASILHAWQQLAPENRAITKCARELDGYVLSSLIRLPIDTNRDVVNAACATLGAVTSTRTLDVLCRKLPHSAFEEKIKDCYDHIPATDTGFAITSQAQLHRAHRAMMGHSASCTTTIRSRDQGLYSSLGIDGLLLHGLEFRATNNQRFDDLIHQLQSLPLAGNSSRGFPLRSTCLIFLKGYCQLDHYPYFNPPLASFLLVFCAGRFTSGDTHEFLCALQCLETVFARHCFFTLPAHNGDEINYISAVVNGLWFVLADTRRYQIDTLTGRIIAHQAVTCFHRVLISDTRRAWAQMSGLFSFARSPAFGQCVGSGHTLDSYILLLKDLQIVYRANDRLEDYWTCISGLWKLSWDHMQWPRQAICLVKRDIIFRVGLFAQDPLLGKGSLYRTPDDWHEPALAAFLDGPNAVASWTGANSPDGFYWDRRELLELAYHISVVLRRRKRLGRSNDSFVCGFFSGTFLLARFQDFVRRGSPYELERVPAKTRLLHLSKHCLDLSPERFMAVLAHLEETGVAGGELRARAAAFAQRLRDGSVPGGELSGECSADCPCMIQSARADAERGWRDVWKALVTRVRRGRTEPATAEHV